MPQAAALVFKCQARNRVPGTDLLQAELSAAARASGLPVARIAAYAAQSVAEIYAYLWLAAPQEIAAAALTGQGEALAGMPAQACALQRVDDRAGASSGADAPYHYIVETDIVQGHEADVYDWYDHEHLGGLAGVAGTVRAQRFFNLSASPWSYACYDLTELGIHDSPPWFKVRSSLWSSRVRPYFRNTKRTMFRRLFDQPPV